MFTGLLPSTHGATGESHHLADKFVTVAEVLLDGGYATFGISANPYISAHYNMVQGFERHDVRPYGHRAARTTLPGKIKERLRLLDYGAADTNHLVTDWVQDACRDGRPFFLFINYLEPHHRYGSTPYFERWLPDTERVSKALRVGQDLAAYITGEVEGTDEDFELLRALYHGDVTYLDEKIGELVESLRTQGVLDDTLLIITSDHGEEFGENGILGHGYTFHSVLLHVPLIVRYPRQFAGGTRRRGVVQLTDLFPTILDVAGIDWSGRSTLQGQSLPTTDSHARQHYAIAEKYIPGPWLTGLLDRCPTSFRVPLFTRGRSIQDDHYRYIWPSVGAPSLYDVVKDPVEGQNLLQELPRKARELRSVLDARFPEVRQGSSPVPAPAESAKVTTPRRPPGPPGRRPQR
jgi:arylsulfatase A-like enzyme